MGSCCFKAGTTFSLACLGGAAFSSTGLADESPGAAASSSRGLQSRETVPETARAVEPARPLNSKVSLQYEPTEPIPDGYVLAQRSRRPIWATGVGLTAIGWAFSAATVAWWADRRAVVPIAGPWLAMVHDHVNSDGAYIGMGAVQAVGFGLIVTGLAWQQDYLVRSDLVRLHFAPAQLGSSGYGISIVGAY